MEKSTIRNILVKDFFIDNINRVHVWLYTSYSIENNKKDISLAVVRKSSIEKARKYYINSPNRYFFRRAIIPIEEILEIYPESLIWGDLDAYKIIIKDPGAIFRKKYFAGVEEEMLLWRKN